MRCQMNKKSIKRYMITFMLLLCFCTTSILASATNTTSPDEAITSVYNIIQNTQKQLNAINERVYINNIEGKSNNADIQLLNFVSSEIDQIISSLSEYQNSVSLNTYQLVRLQTLITSANIVKVMQNTLLDYATSTVPIDQLQILKIYLRLDSVLTQLLIDFKYLSENPNL